jgi:pimeloyl-ACP methyl ester carboxylesterase
LPFTTVNGTSLHYRLEGASGPAVILLHEIGGALDSWDGVVPTLSPHFRVLRYDQRGFGLSEKVRAPYTIATLADDLEGLIADLGLTAPFHIVSLAASSMQALEFHRRDAARVASLVFCNPAPGVEAARAGALENVAALAEREGIRGVLPTMLDKSYKPELSDRATYEEYRGRYLANDPVGFGLAFRMMAHTNMMAELANIACPTLVVAGRQDAIRAIPVTEGIAGKIPGARFEIIDAGHFMPTTSPTALTQLLVDFWRTEARS